MLGPIPHRTACLAAWTQFLHPWETESDTIRNFQKLRLPGALDVFKPRFLIAALLLTSGDRTFVVVGLSCLCRLSSNISGLHPLE